VVDAVQFRQRDKRYVFIAFDIIATGPSTTDSHVDKPFTERLKILVDFLSDKCVVLLLCLHPILSAGV
jgi:ATP-dependent DNA ligase